VNNALFSIPENTPGPPGTTGMTGYEYDPQQLPQLLSSGQWARPLQQGLPESTNPMLTAVISSPAINMLWRSSKIAIAKVSTAGLGFNPCEQDLIFSQGDKYCDGETMYIVQAWPQSQDLESYTSTGPEMVPGFTEIATYGLTVEAIVLASEVLTQFHSYLSCSLAN
jgi:hypothetical protein